MKDKSAKSVTRPLEVREQRYKRLKISKSAAISKYSPHPYICDPTLEKGPYGALCNFRLWASKVDMGASGQN